MSSKSFRKRLPFLSASTKTRESPRYEDDYCTIYNDKLVIKKYFFPTKQSKVIRLSNIQAVYYVKQNGPNEACRVSAWGTPFTPIWWALDVNRLEKRCYRLFFHVIIEANEPFMKGFTVKDVCQFLDVIRKLLPEETLYVNDFPI